MPWTVSNLQRPFREDFSLEKSGIIAEKESQIFERRFIGFDRPKKRRPFSISKKALAAASETAGRRRPLRPHFFYNRRSLTWTPKTQAVSSATLKKSVFLCTVRALEPCRWRGRSCLSFGTAHPSAASPARVACSIAGRDADTPQAEDALYRVEDIAAKTLEYMTAMEAAPQLKASGLDGDYRILADFGGTVLAGTPSKYGVQFVTWDWDYDRTGVSHGHYFMENYRRSLRLRQDHSLQSHGAVLGRAVRQRAPAHFHRTGNYEGRACHHSGRSHRQCRPRK